MDESSTTHQHFDATGARVLQFPALAAPPVTDEVWQAVLHKVDALKLVRPDLSSMLARAAEDLVDRWLASLGRDGVNLLD